MSTTCRQCATTPSSTNRMRSATSKRRATVRQTAPGLMPPSEELPPAAQTLHGKLRGLVRHPDIDEALVATHIVGAVGDRRTFPQVWVVIDIDLQRLSLRTPSLTAVFEVPDPLLLLGVDRQNGLAAVQILFHLAVEVAKLLIPPGSRPFLLSLYVSLERVSQLPQSPPHRLVARRVPLPCQLLRNAGCGLIRPAQQTHRITSGILVHDPVQGLLPSGVQGFQPFPPSAGPPNALTAGQRLLGAQLPNTLQNRGTRHARCLVHRPQAPT